MSTCVLTHTVAGVSPTRRNQHSQQVDAAGLHSNQRLVGWLDSFGGKAGLAEAGPPDCPPAPRFGLKRRARIRIPAAQRSTTNSVRCGNHQRCDLASVKGSASNVPGNSLLSHALNPLNVGARLPRARVRKKKACIQSVGNTSSSCW